MTSTITIEFKEVALAFLYSAHFCLLSDKLNCYIVYYYAIRFATAQLLHRWRDILVLYLHTCSIFFQLCSNCLPASGKHLSDLEIMQCFSVVAIIDQMK